MNARNEKTRREAGYSEALGGGTPWTSGNSFWRKQLPKVTAPKRDAATETLFQSSGIQSHSSSKIPPRTCYQWPLPVAHKRIRTIRNHELSSCWVQRSAKKGNPHMAKRATAHHSLLRLASVGLCNSGTGKPTAPLKKREAACPKG